MRAEFIAFEIFAGRNTSKLLRRDGGRKPIHRSLLEALIDAQHKGLTVDWRRL